MIDFKFCLLIIFIILFTFVSGWFLGRYAQAEPIKIKKCDSSYMLTRKNVGKEFVNLIKSIPVSRWNKEQGISFEIFTFIKSKKITLRDNGVVFIDFVMIRLDSKLLKELEEFYDSILCQVEDPEVILMMEILKEI